MFSRFSNFTPHCIDFVKAFKGMPGITTHEEETFNDDGTFSYFEGAIYLNKMECLGIKSASVYGEYMLYINNPLGEQLVFGYYDTFEKAIERAKEIVRARKYPKPIEIW